MYSRHTLALIPLVVTLMAACGRSPGDVSHEPVSKNANALSITPEEPTRSFRRALVDGTAVDFNGDGKSDLYFHWADGNNWVGLSTGSGFSWSVWSNAWPFDLGTDVNNADVRIGDFNGDGMSDLYFHWADGHDWVGLSTGSSFSWSLWSGQWLYNLEDDTNNAAIRLGDFNGDGKTDLYFLSGANGIFNHIGLSTGSGFTWQAWPGIPQFPVGTDQDNGAIRVADFNGDGMSDVYFHYYDKDFVGLSSGSGFTWSLWSTSWAFHLGTDANNGAIRVADFNGDGMSDLYFHWNDGHDWVALSNGSTFTWSLWSTSWAFDLGTDANNGAIRVGDFNGDGMSDLYFHWNDGHDWVASSNGSSFTWSLWSTSWAFGLGADLNSGAIRVADFDGDGTSDLYFHWEDGHHWVGLSSGSAFSWGLWSSQWAFNLGTDGNNADVRAQTCGNGECECPNGLPLGSGTNCGSCGNACASGVCRNGACLCPITGTPGSVEQEKCGNCSLGTQSRTCEANGAWSAWSECSGGGACAPGQSETCDGNGTQTCGSACQWNSCACPAGEQLCNGACVDTQTNVGNCGWCGNQCLSTPGCGGPVCSGGTCQGHFYCGYSDGSTRQVVALSSDSANAATCLGDADSVVAGECPIQ